MLQEFRRDKRDVYFLGARGLRKAPARKHGRCGWYPLALIVVALVMVRVLVDFM